MINEFSAIKCLNRCVLLGIRLVLFTGIMLGFKGFSIFITFLGFIQFVEALIFCCGLCSITFLSVTYGFATISMSPNIYLSGTV